ncbi:S24 family peptidase [Novosphingobium sp. JCM 18896]|uniref:S24 family peptidase n=1 Tax=Novosphingobium sp. JCM 18896 TaxID=2989731 RepID=UPI002223074F|nr:S24 family peptidase [Novosphingobium sp. JCM 18896]MCW1427963.1 S24 family peptidase [Novosphingobium sp. JCM 18896]
MAASDPRQRLLELAGERGVSLAQLSAMIGRNSTYLQQFVRKGSPRKLEENDRATLARFFAVGEAELGRVEEKSSESDWIDVPRLALGASAGPGAAMESERPIGALRFARGWLRGQGLDPRQLSAITVEGDSMEPVLRDGDEILVDLSPRPLRDGIHVVRVDGLLLVKRLETGRPGLVVLRSANPAYDPIELAVPEVTVVGRVVWKGGRL